jgi:hypothetical protein
LIGVPGTGSASNRRVRKDFLPNEIGAIRRALAPTVEAAARERQGTRTDIVETFHEVEANKTRAKLDAFPGVSGRPVEEIAKVIATTALIVATTNRRSERRLE